MPSFYLAGPERSRGAVAILSSVTWNPSDKDTGLSVSNGNLTVAATTNADGCIRATASQNSGAFVFELHFDGANSDNLGFGVATASAALNTYLGGDAFGWGYATQPFGSVWNNNAEQIGGLGQLVHGDVLGVGVTVSGGTTTLTFWQNGMQQGAGITIANGDWFPSVQVSTTGSQITANFGHTAFAFSYPGFSPWGS